jgi:hypothetical protein
VKLNVALETGIPAGRLVLKSKSSNRVAENADDQLFVVRVTPSA